MPAPEPTEIRINENKEEFHESWILLRFSNIFSQPGAKLFDSEIRHSQYIRMTVTRCTRQRDLNRDWLHSAEQLMEIDMSKAQFGAFVSSFGNGGGVPATLSWFDGRMVPGVSTNDSRLAQSHEDVKNAASRAVEAVQKAHKAVQEAFEQKLGTKVTRERLRTLEIVMGNLPSNMEFAAKSLSEHTENVIQKARADVEGMVMNAVRMKQKELPPLESLLLPSGE